MLPLSTARFEDLVTRRRFFQDVHVDEIQAALEERDRLVVAGRSALDLLRRRSAGEEIAERDFNVLHEQVLKSLTHSL